MRSDARHAAEPAGKIGDQPLARKIAAAFFEPTLRHARPHAKRLQHGRVAAHRLGEGAPRGRLREGFARRRACRNIGDQRECAQHEGAEQHRATDQGVKKKADHEIERHPRQVEERRKTGAGRERANRIEVAQRLQARRRTMRLRRRAHHYAEQARAQRFIERLADPHQHTRTQRFKQRLEPIESKSEQRETDQRRHAAARQHPVVDLQHEQRPVEHQQVGKAARERHSDESLAAGAEGFAQLRRQA